MNLEYCNSCKNLQKFVKVKLRTIIFLQKEIESLQKLKLDQQTLVKV